MKSSRPHSGCPPSRLTCSTPNQVTTAAAALANSAGVLPIAYFICGQSRKAWSDSPPGKRKVRSVYPPLANGGQATGQSHF